MSNDTAVITLSASGKKVRIPREMFNKADAIAIRQYAYESGQATKSEAGISDEYKPEVNALEAAGVAAISRLKDTGLGIKQAFNETLGDPDEAIRNRWARQNERAFTAPARLQHPLASFLGSMGPDFAVPGGKIAQGGAGFIEGLAQGETPAGRLGMGAVGAGLGLAGARLGDIAGAKTTDAIAGRQRSSSNLAASTSRLADAGVPVPIWQRPSVIPGLKRDPAAQLTSSIRGIITGSKLPGGSAQIKRMNELALKSIGERGDEVTLEALSSAHTRIGSVFDNAANSINEVPLGRLLRDPNKFSEFAALTNDIADLGTGDTFAGQIKRFYGEISDAATGNGIISGKRYNQIRQKLGRASRAAWKKGDEVAGEAADSLIDFLDDAMELGNPQIAEQLSGARAQWRMLRVLRKARAIDPEGNINQRSIENAFRSIYPGAEVGKFGGNAAGRFGQALADLNATAIPRQTSNTTENALRVAGIGGVGGLAAAGFPAPAAIGSGVLGVLGFGGGGTGSLLGGDLARGILFSELQRQRQQQNN